MNKTPESWGFEEDKGLLRDKHVAHLVVGLPDHFRPYIVTASRE